MGEIERMMRGCGRDGVVGEEAEEGVSGCRGRREGTTVAWLQYTTEMIFKNVNVTKGEAAFYFFLNSFVIIVFALIYSFCLACHVVKNGFPPLKPPRLLVLNTFITGYVY